MILHFMKKSANLLHCGHIIASNNNHLLQCILRLSTSKGQKDQPSNPHFMVEYLMKSLDFSMETATKACKRLTDLKSPENPDSVLTFLRKHGFTDTHVKSLVSQNPKVLLASVDRTLEPIVKAFHDIGFSNSNLPSMVASVPFALTRRSTVSRIEFWKDFFGGDNKKVFIAIKRNKLILYSVSSSITRKVALLKRHEVPQRSIVAILMRASRFISRSEASIKELLQRAIELGFQPESDMFVNGMHALTNASREKVEEVMKLMKKYGWSEQQFVSAVQKSPEFVQRSLSCIQAKMDFLVWVAGCQPSYISSNPVLLLHSLVMKLMPRHNVLQILKSKGVTVNLTLCSLMAIPEKKFIERFILAYKEEIPEIHEAYAPACASKIPIKCEGS